MSTSVNSTVNLVPQYIFIYVGIPTLIVGFLGEILNVIVFLSLKTFRQSSCAFFLTIMSFVNMGQLLTSLLSRIMITGFNIDWTEMSFSYCKFRNCFLQACTLMSYTCMCLATIDQYLATSLRPQWQQFFNIKRAYLFSVSLFIIIGLCHGIPTLIWYDLVLSFTTGKMTCIITNSIFQEYIAYGYTIIFTGILPILITVVFGCMAYWNVRQIPYRIVPLVRRELDKQLTSMVLMQVVLSLFFNVPYVILTCLLYTLDLTSKSINLSVFNMAFTVAGMIFYFHFASPFYIYVCVSKRFRQQLFHVLSDIYVKYWKRQPIATNQVLPEGEEL